MNSNGPRHEPRPPPGGNPGGNRSAEARVPAALVLAASLALAGCGSAPTYRPPEPSRACAGKPMVCVDPAGGRLRDSPGACQCGRVSDFML